MLKNNIQLTLPNTVLDKIKEVYKTPNTSDAIRSGLCDFLFLPAPEQKIDSCYLNQFTDVYQREDTKKISLRIPEELHRILISLSGSESLSNTILSMLSRIIYKPLDDRNDTEKQPLIKILGSKWDKKMQNAIRNIKETSGKQWKLSVEPCAGALGIHTNIHFAEKEVVNDDDYQKINLYKAVKNHHHELYLKARSIEVTEESFKKVKGEQKKSTSVRNSGSSFHKMSFEKYREVLEAIYPLHKRLQNTKILEKDILKLIQKYQKQPNSLFIVDPNYLQANVYHNRTIREPEHYGTSFGLPEHKQLAKLLRSIKKNQGSDFIYFCRITTTRTTDSKNNIVLTDEQIAFRDKDLLEKINTLYHGANFYYIDVPLKQGTIERIITSFHFEGATCYELGGI